MMKSYGNITSVDRNGNLSINGTFNFDGTLLELKNIINKTIEEFGEDTNCELETIGSFPHRWDSHIILKLKDEILL